MVYNNIKYFLKSIINSYSIIFFSDKYLFSILLLFVSFFDIFAGLNGLISVIVAFVTANMLGFDKYKIQKGYYGFNSLLLGLGIGLNFEASWIVIFVMIFAAIFSLFTTVTLEGILGKYGLPYLSLPFLVSYWIIGLATKELHFLTLSSRGVYYINELYVLGGSKLIGYYEWWSGFEFITSLKYYFLSIGAIFFQYNVISGIIVAIGLLYFSRIAFSLSLIGFYTAYFIYQSIGAQITELGYAYIGFNYILTAIAIGGYFLVPSKSSYLWVIILMPMTVLLTIAFGRFFSIWQLYIYSISFNVIVISFLYILKLRVIKHEGLTEVTLHQSTPEENLYTYLGNNHRFKDNSYFSLNLPFYGEWNVSQAHNGEITHKDKWRYAWDFVIKGNENKTYNGDGNRLEDYYCYGKAVLSPMNGYVEEIIDGIPDNIIGDVNIENNWGNTIIIRHGDYFFSKLSHLKQGSFRVSKGEWVKTGQLIASCGSSGRSPEPHLHFQLQATPLLEGETIDYPIGQYLKKTSNGLEYKSYYRPKLDDNISNIEINSLLSEVFHFIPGQKINFEINEKGKTKLIEWEVITDIYNYSYIYCKKTNSLAYFSSDDKVFYFYKFSGNKKSLLFYFFLASYKIPLGFYKDLTIKDTLAINLVYSYLGLFIQDFIAPFFIFLKSEFNLKYENISDVINAGDISLSSSITKYFFGKKTGQKNFELKISNKKIESLTIKLKNKKITANCIESN